MNETILEDVDGYLVMQAKKLLCDQYKGRYREIQDLEIDELTQRARIKLWKTLEKEAILYPYSYIRRIVYSEFIDMKRQQKQLSPLPNDEEEAGSVFPRHEDPADDIVRQIEFARLLRWSVQMIKDLPFHQRMAMIHQLCKWVDDQAQLYTVLAEYGLAISSCHWPQEPKKQRAMLASLSVARQKLAKRKQQETVEQQMHVSMV